MAGSNIKQEAITSNLVQAPPYMANVPSGITKDNIESIEMVSIPIDTGDTHNFDRTHVVFSLPGPLWRDCHHLDLLQQVEVKEKAVKEALTYIDEMSSVLEIYSSEVSSVTKWLTRIGMFS